VTTIRGRPYFFMMRLRDFSAAALSRFALTTVSAESGQASGLSHAANCNAGIADRKFALAVSGR
jgi:hypothetical protein